MMDSTAKRTSLALVAAAIGMALPGAAHAETVHSSAYAVAFIGIPVGKMTNSISVDGKNYSIVGSVRANSMISMVSKTSANFSSAGTIDGTRIIPASHSHEFKTSKKKGSLQMNFSGGDVRNISANPVINYKPGTVPVKKTDLDNVIDPLSSLIVAVGDNDIGNGEKICNRTLPMFDGRVRSNLRFSFKSSASEKVEGFNGETFTCAVRYQPVSGMRPFKKDVKFMTQNRDMQVTLARVGNTNLYTLFGFRVRTDKGMVSGEAYRFATQ